ncbi:STAS domain-containing protein [Streptomyces sp. NPDC001941]|uniref:STAS domain-containing protein n=1 Tax=Streptomyces sp. NPDC001941 TaxID=3154659 RepID=UPI003328C6D8
MRAAPERKVHVTRHEKVFLITVSGETDYDDGSEFDAAWGAADRAALPTTEVDLSRVTFADSMLLNALLDGLRRHEEGGRTLVLVGPLTEAVDRLLTVSGTRELFTVTRTGTGPSQVS